MLLTKGNVKVRFFYLFELQLPHVVQFLGMNVLI